MYNKQIRIKYNKFKLCDTFISKIQILYHCKPGFSSLFLPSSSPPFSSYILSSPEWNASSYSIIFISQQDMRISKGLIQTQNSRNYREPRQRIKRQFDSTRFEKPCFPRSRNFRVSHSGSDRLAAIQPVLYSLFIETTAKHDTPVVVTPPRLYDSPLCEGLLARKIPEASIVGATALRCILVEGEKEKRKKKRRSFIMELRNCKLSKYNGRPVGPRACILPACATARCTGPLQHLLNIELRATKVTPI